MDPLLEVLPLSQAPPPPCATPKEPKEPKEANRFLWLNPWFAPPRLRPAPWPEADMAAVGGEEADGTRPPLPQ